MYRKGWLLAAVAVVLVSGLACGDAPAESVKSGIVATVGDRNITLTELDEAAMAKNVGPYQQLYEARKAILTQMLEEQLIETEAASTGVSVEELIRAEITEKIETPPSDAQIEAFYTQNQNRMGGRTLDQMKAQISVYLSQQATVAARAEYLDKLKAKADIRVSLEPPRVDIEIAENDPTTGPASAPITIVEFSDFECPYCRKVGESLASIKEAYGDKVRIIFRDYPLSFHKQAKPAAEAAQCAHEQDKFWEYHDLLFANQKALGDEDLKKYAGDLGLDADAFNECYDSGRYSQDVMADFQYGSKMGVTGTPAFFINGRFLNGAQPFEKFKEIIDEELEGRES